jgi:hypothetical protein
MPTRTPDVASPVAGPGAPPAPHSIFILPELAKGRQHDLTILILADGNTRSRTNQGYAGGARKIVTIAEHLARRRDVGAMIACILSPENIARRGQRFFAEIYREFIHLGVEIATRGALVASGVHLEVWGDIDSLRARGGHAALLADAIVAVAAMTEGVIDPALRLILGVGYGRDTATRLDVDLLLRTGMEEPGVLRLSGLQTSARITSAATATLWPDIEPREVDELLALCPRRTTPRLGRGHGISAMIDLLVALAKADHEPPLRLTIPTSATGATVTAALERLYAGPLRGCETVAALHARVASEGPRRHGPGERARHVVHIVGGLPEGEPFDDGELLSVLAPGQRPPSFTLPAFLALHHANVHACGASARDLMSGIRAAQRFSAAHPRLMGRDRPRAVDLAPDPSPAARGLVAARDRDELADAFAAKMLGWAASTGLLLHGEAWRKAALNYALTAFFIHFEIPTEWDLEAAEWEERAELTAKYMLLVAAGDEGIFDRIIEGETPSPRWTRLDLSARFLRGWRTREEPRAAPPSVEGADLLAAIAEGWRRLEAPYRRTCHPAALASFHAGLDDLYTGSLAEHRADVGTSPSPLTRAPGEGAARDDLSARIEARFAAAPTCLAARARELARAAATGGEQAAKRELRALAYLTEVGGAIGAGLLFRVAALAAPARWITDRQIATLDASAALLDYHVRLSNDMSGFLESPGGDRDPKENACTILVPHEASGVARAAAIVDSLATCRSLAAWLGVEVGDQIARLASAWPSMAACFQRGVFVGRRVYEVGHYTTVSRAGISAIFAEADAALGAGPSRRSPGAYLDESVNSQIIAWSRPGDLLSVRADP